MNEDKNHVGCLSKPIKNQIKTSKVSVFIILAGQLRSNRHWQCSQRAPARKSSIHTSDEPAQKPCWMLLHTKVTTQKEQHIVVKQTHKQLNQLLLYLC